MAPWAEVRCSWMKVEGWQEPSLLLHLRPSIALTVTSKPVMVTVLVFPGKHDPPAVHKHDPTCNFCAPKPPNLDSPDAYFFLSIQNSVQIKEKQKQKSWGRRDASAVKSTDCLSEGLGSSSQPPSGGSQPSVIPLLGCLIPFLTSGGDSDRHASVAHTYIQATLTQKINHE